MMKRVGIVTIIDNNNYGNRLQNYAVQSIIERNNNSSLTLKNVLQLNKKGESRLKYKLKVIKYTYLNHKINNKREKLFNEFNKNIKFSKRIFNWNKLNKIEKCDIWLVGSDQVWNPNFGMSDIDFLTFAEKEPKISFSASFGVNELPDDIKEYVKEEIKTFKKISVREDAGKTILEELTGRTDIEVLVDPTMLLSAEEWDKVSKKPEQLKFDKYILNYFLGDLSEEWKNEINRIAKENNCEIINILDKNSPFYQTGPSEFLYLEKNAFLVCTDSFHSSVFSIIYDTPFVVFDRKQNGIASMNSRIDTLLTKFCLQNRRFNGSITEELLSCDYSKTKKILEKEKEKSFDFLEKALDIK